MGPVLDSAEISRIYHQRLYIGLRSTPHVFSLRDQKVPWVYSHGRWPNLKRNEYIFLMLLRTSSWICHTITFADNPLVKITHMAKFNINGGELYSVRRGRCCKITWKRCGSVILLMGNEVLGAIISSYPMSIKRHVCSIIHSSKDWKQPKCLSATESMNRMWCIHRL